MALKKGSAAPEIKLPTMDGKEFKLSEARKHGPVVLAFFKVSCPVCQYAFPFLERMHQGYKGKGVTFAGVSQDDKKDTAMFQREFGGTFPVGLDDPHKYEVSNAYGLTHVPTVFLVSSEGKIEQEIVGWDAADMSTLNRRVAESCTAKAAELFRKNEEVVAAKPG